MTDLTKLVSLLPGDVLSFREERIRKEFLLSIARAYDYAVRLEVERRRRVKRVRRVRHHRPHP